MTLKDIPLTLANAVLKQATLKTLVGVNHAWRTLPAPEFAVWLQQALEAAERMP